MRCQNCNTQVFVNQSYCINCGTPIDKNYIQSSQNKFSAHKKNNNSGLEIFIIISLIFYFPIGLPLMWIFRPFTKKTRWIVSLSFIIAVFLGFALIIIWTTNPGYLY